MMGDVFLSLIILAALMVLVVAVPRSSPTWHREKRMFVASQKLEFSYARNGESLLDEGVSDAPIFALARIRQSKISNLLRGKSGAHEVTICDYHYWTGKSIGEQFDADQTVFCFDLKVNRLPDFTLHPRTKEHLRKLTKLGFSPPAPAQDFGGAHQEQATSEFFRALIERTRGKGIEIPGHRVFSGRYQLHASDSLAANAAFSLEALDFFERECAPLPSVEKAGDWLVVYREGVLVRPENLLSALQEAEKIRALFKP